jgi:hypothetical protein
MARSSKDNPSVALVRDFSNPISLTWEGKVFGISNPTVGTEIVGQTSFANTLATFSLRNLGSKAMVPLYALLGQAGPVAGGVIVVSVQTLDTDQFTSGTQVTVRNRNQRNSDGSSVLAFHTATLPTFTTGNANQVFAREVFQTVSAANADNTINAFGYPGICVVRPTGAIHIYTDAAITGPSWSFSITWAELEV